MEGKNGSQPVKLFFFLFVFFSFCCYYYFSPTPSLWCVCVPVIFSWPHFSQCSQILSLRRVHVKIRFFLYHQFTTQSFLEKKKSVNIERDVMVVVVVEVTLIWWLFNVGTAEKKNGDNPTFFLPYKALYLSLVEWTPSIRAPTVTYSSTVS